ncbi:MAG: L,D-transpeptidase [Candidatus Moranbacteria bacterium]|nr:L,D-transpeptidase [Candidatus Moranbacteria bacterium]
MKHRRFRYPFAVIALVLYLFPSLLLAVDYEYYGSANDNSDMMIDRSVSSGGSYAPGLSRSDVDTDEAPAGFGWYLMKAGDDIWKICGSDSERRIMFENLNRVDMYHLGKVVGRKVLVPIDMEKARSYVPESIRDHVKYDGRTILIDKKTQYFAAYEEGKLLFWGAVSSAANGYVTSTGVFRILDKQRNHWSSKYHVDMPFSLRYFNGQFLHFGILIGGTSSSGCVHLSYENSVKVYEWMRIGDRVVIV